MFNRSAGPKQMSPDLMGGKPPMGAFGAAPAPKKGAAPSFLKKGKKKKKGAGKIPPKLGGPSRGAF